jgi:hypothetical protein
MLKKTDQSSGDTIEIPNDFTTGEALGNGTGFLAHWLRE